MSAWHPSCGQGQHERGVNGKLHAAPRSGSPLCVSRPGGQGPHIEIMHQVISECIMRVASPGSSRSEREWQAEPMQEEGWRPLECRSRALLARRWGMLRVAVQQAVASTPLGRASPAPLHTSATLLRSSECCGSQLRLKPPADVN